MATVTRTVTWSDNQVLTATALNGEFDNLLNALALVNADISASAAIAYTKLNLTGNIVNADIKSTAAIVESKVLFSGSGHGHTGGTDGKLITTTLYRAFGFSIPGTLYVANDLSWNPVSPQSVTAVKTWAYIKTAPTGANLILSLYNITKAAVVGTVTISDGQQTGNSTSYTTSAIVAGDALRLDCTQVGSTVAGADVTVVLECSEP